MYVSSELQVLVITKMLLLCFMKQCNLADSYGAFVVGREHSADMLKVQKLKSCFFLKRWCISTNLYVVMTRKCITFIYDTFSNV